MPPNNIVGRQKIDPQKLKRAKDLRRTMTPAEKRLWQALRGRSLSNLKFRRQQVIDGFIVDFYCSAANLIVELDGPIHMDQIRYDSERTRILEARGLNVVRFRNDEILDDLEGCLQRILLASQK